jgi:hypothetical protein
VLSHENAQAPLLGLSTPLKVPSSLYVLNDHVAAILSVKTVEVTNSFTINYKYDREATDSGITVCFIAVVASAALVANLPESVSVIFVYVPLSVERSLASGHNLSSSAEVAC